MEEGSTFYQTNSGIILRTILSSGLTRKQEIKKIIIILFGRSFCLWFLFFFLFFFSTTFVPFLSARQG